MVEKVQLANLPERLLADGSSLGPYRYIPRKQGGLGNQRRKSFPPNSRNSSRAWPRAWNRALLLANCQLKDEGTLE